MANPHPLYGQKLGRYRLHLPSPLLAPLSPSSPPLRCILGRREEYLQRSPKASCSNRLDFTHTTKVEFCSCSCSYSSSFSYLPFLLGSSPAPPPAPPAPPAPSPVPPPAPPPPLTHPPRSAPAPIASSTLASSGTVWLLTFRFLKR